MGIIDDIKRDAEWTNTKIQGTAEKDFEAKINNLFYLDKDIENELVFLRSVMTRGQETAERKGLHASAIIKSENNYCLRQMVLSLFYKQLQGEQINVRLKRIFSEGDAIHEKLQRLFIRGGYVKPLDCDYTLYDDRYDLTYTPDLNHVVIDGVEYVGEIKSVNTMQFKKMVNENKPHESGKKQLMLYMYLTGIHKGFVLCEDKNTQDIKVYLYDFDRQEVEPYIKRLEEIQEAKKRLLKKHKIPKKHYNCTGYSCDMARKCPLKNVCYGISKERI